MPLTRRGNASRDVVMYRVDHRIPGAVELPPSVTTSS
jgi:hypothetical protein